MTTQQTGADLFMAACEQYGVEHLFGNPGTTELPLMRSLESSDIEYVLGLHEDIAVGMAAGYATTRRYESQQNPDVLPVGVVNLHVAPGLAHGLGNLYDAQWAGAPLVITAGDHSTTHRDQEPILGGDLTDIAEPFVKWSDEASTIETLPEMIRRAFRTALTPPTGPVFLGLPLDVMLAETTQSPKPLGAIPNAGRGDPAQINTAVDTIVNAETPVMIVGDHIARSGGVQAAVEFAEATGARVHGEILSAEVNFPTSHNQWVSFIPSSGDAAADLMDTDTLLFVGCSTHTPVVEYDGDLISDTTTCVHIGPDGWDLGKNYDADTAVLGDPRLVLEELTEHIESTISAETIQDRLDAIAPIQEQTSPSDISDPDDPRMSKADLVEVLQDTTPDAYVVDEGVTSKYVMLSRWDFEEASWIGNKGGGLGYGLPASIGAAIAEQERDSPRDVIGFIGDGSYLYYPHSIYTAARLDIDITIVIPDNRNYRILKDNMLAIMGGEESDYDFTEMEFDPPVNIPETAGNFGGDGHLIETTDELADQLDRARNSSGPTVLDVLVHD